MRPQRLTAPLPLSVLYSLLLLLLSAAAPAAADRLAMPSPPQLLPGPSFGPIYSCNNGVDGIALSVVGIRDDASALLLHVTFSYTPPPPSPAGRPATVVTVRFGSPPYSDAITLTTSGATVTGEATVIVEYNSPPAGFVTANISCDGVGNIEAVADILGQFVPYNPTPPLVMGFYPNFNSAVVSQLDSFRWNLAVTPGLPNRNLVLGAVDGASDDGTLKTWEFGDQNAWGGGSTSSTQPTTLPVASHSSLNVISAVASADTASLSSSYQLFGWFAPGGLDFTPVVPPQLLCASFSNVPVGAEIACAVLAAPGTTTYAWISVALSPLATPSQCTVTFGAPSPAAPYITWDGATVHTMSLPVVLNPDGTMRIRSGCLSPVLLRVTLVGLFSNVSATPAPSAPGTTQPASPPPQPTTTPPAEQTPTPAADTTQPPTPRPSVSQAPTGPPVSGPPRVTPAPTTPQPSPPQPSPPPPPPPPPQTPGPSLAPQTPEPASVCTGVPPVVGAVCVSGAWWLPSLNLTSTMNISNLPIVIGTNLKLDPGSVTVITPTANSTLFIIVQGTAHIDGTLIVDLSGRNYTATYTTVAVVRAGALQGGYDTIRVEKPPKSCEKYSAWTAQTSTTLNAVLLRDDSNCKSGGKGVGRWGAIAGGVVFGSVILIIGVLIIMFKTGVLSATSFVMLAKSDDEGKL